MNLKEDDGISLSIKAKEITTEETKSLRAELLVDFRKLYADFLGKFEELNTILNTSKDKNLLYYYEEINKSLTIFVREADTIDTDKFNTNKCSNMERPLKRNLNFLAKLLYSPIQNKALIVSIDNNCVDLFAITRFLHDTFNIEKNQEGNTPTFVKEIHRMAQEFNNRYPRYNGFNLEVKDYTDEIEVRIANPNQTGLRRTPRETVQEINKKFDKFMNWELRKFEMDLDCNVLVSNVSVSIAINHE